MSARELLKEVVPELEYSIHDIPGEDDLLAMGIGSGDLIRLALLIEERTEMELTPDNLDRLYPGQH